MVSRRSIRSPETSTSSQWSGCAGVIADRISKVPGVRPTQTYIAFQTFSRHDLESAFSLGMQD